MRDRVIQLQERAEDLGFSTITEALDAGYHEVQDLVTGIFTLEKLDEQEKAHEAWLKERDEVLEELKQLHEHLTMLGYDALAESVYKAINFIRGCHD